MENPTEKEEQWQKHVDEAKQNPKPGEKSDVIYIGGFCGAIIAPFVVHLINKSPAPDHPGQLEAFIATAILAMAPGALLGILLVWILRSILTFMRRMEK